MKLTPRLRHAINLASRLHKDQLRKTDKPLPYVSHLFGVAFILENYTDDEDIVIAGLLHDSIEDIEGYTYERLVQDAGQRVADIVEACSEDKSLKYLERKQKYIEKVIAGGKEAMMVCAADKIHNMSSILDTFKEEGEENILEKFQAKKFGDGLQFFAAVIEALKPHLDSPIIKELEETYALTSAALIK